MRWLLRIALAALAFSNVAGVACAAEDDKDASAISAGQVDSTVALPIAGDPTADAGYCVIRPDEPASVEIFADYDGQRFYFCCQSCKEDFLSDPERFASQGTNAETNKSVNEAAMDLSRIEGLQADYQHSFWGKLGQSVNRVSAFAVKVDSILHLSDPINAVLVIAVIVTLMGVRRLSKSPRMDEVPRRAKMGAAAGLLILFVPAFYAASIRRSWLQLQQSHQRLVQEHERMSDHYQEKIDRNLLHYATLMNFGSPPIPRPNPSPPQLQRTYYRGNDERFDEMPYGGRYRTVTFKLWLEDADGQQVAVGSDLADASGQPIPLFLVVEVIRASETSSGYFTDEYMRRMYLTMQGDEFLGRDKPVSDRVDWEAIDPQWKWQATFELPLGVTEPVQKYERDKQPQWRLSLDATRPLDRSGFVYLCEERYEGDRLLGGRFHYAVAYRLEAIEGKVAAGSDLWMQATYRGRNFAELQIRDDEWLSEKPIPEQ